MDPYIGEIRLFAGNFAPYGWALCNGALLPISMNTALFSLLGTAYGGDGRTTFGLPDLRGRAPIHWGTGNGLTPRDRGEIGGAATVTLIQSEMPMHTHQAQGAAESGVQSVPAGAVWAELPASGFPPESPPLYATTPRVTMNLMALAPSGGSQPHTNVQPALGLNFIIALQGIFPPRS